MQLFKLKYFIIKRDLGLWIFLIAIVASWIGHVVCALSYQSALIFIAFIASIIFTNYNNRKDKYFIDRYLIFPKAQVAGEYIVLLLPVFVVLILHQFILFAFLLVLLLASLAFIRVPSISVKTNFIGRFIPSRHFEWVSGIRKNIFFISLLIIPIIALSPVKLFALIFLALLNFLFISFYGYFEPLQMLNTFNMKFGDFLWDKVKFFIRMLIITNGPVLAVNTIFYPEAAWFNLLFLLSFFVISACSIYIKYAQYEPNGNLRFSADYLILVSTLFLPFMLPVGFGLLLMNRKKAINNLNHYLC